ncbi:beta-phosphoglucomutase [Geminisphaera colitermitum]|uniref:beta-phosphoglucomutase n=1 Tax=Geminisphaera colitermitum TaxID=1148786 RepID=UPI0005BD5DFB|nr:beta-phosphoglucomutase [Geminisphaera colitermitum]
MLPAFITTARGAIFDLDGVIVDTARYHYLAWKRLAAELGFTFTETHNERLKGVSRMRSLEILLEVGGITATSQECEEMAVRKNVWYVDYIRNMDASELLPGARDYLKNLRARGVKIALGSASKNAPLILENLRITELFDAIVDGNHVSKAKPDPEVFLLGARRLDLSPADCVVYEDAEAGIEAAHRAGMKTVGIGTAAALPAADFIAPDLRALLGA